MAQESISGSEMGSLDLKLHPNSIFEALSGVNSRNVKGKISQKDSTKVPSYQENPLNRFSSTTAEKVPGRTNNMIIPQQWAQELNPTSCRHTLREEGRPKSRETNVFVRHIRNMSPTMRLKKNKTMTGKEVTAAHLPNHFAFYHKPQTQIELALQGTQYYREYTDQNLSNNDRVQISNMTELKLADGDP